MRKVRVSFFSLFAFAWIALSVLLCGAAQAQSNAGTLNGTVTDPTGAVVPGASVTITNVVSGYTRTVTTDADGHFMFPNVPFNPYIVLAKMKGFSQGRKEVLVNSAVPQTIAMTLPLAGATQEVTVDAPIDLTETNPTMHADIDRSTIARMAIESPTSALSSIVTLASPGVAADSNGLMHGLGDHAENSFSIDGQPITDQQSKVFSNQVPAAAIQSLEVIDGAPPAEYGDKTSLVVVATTRSGQGVTTPTGDVSVSYGSFGSTNVAFDVAYGKQKWGNFIAANGMQTGRFLDTPEHAVMHDKGNEENVFDRVDYQFTPKDLIHTNFQYTRSWFQTPNDYENYGVTNQLTGAPVGNADQRSKIGTVDFAPTYTRTISDDSVANFGVYIRRDAYNYYPSNNPLADYALNQQQESVAQARSLTNAGVHADISYVHGINNVKIGGDYNQTLLNEHDDIGIIDPTIVTPLLAPYDLDAGGVFYDWNGHTDVKELGLYGEDQISVKNWVINAGIRGDMYHGLTIQDQAEPRLGVSYTIQKTGTVLRSSYARTQETPFNENLVLSSEGCADPVLYAIFATLSDGSCSAQAITPFNPGFRNEFHTGFEQAIGRHFVFNGEYIWKYTHNAYDFSVLGTTPITFPIEWHNSKIPGYAISATLTQVKGVSVRFNASSVAARFFTPQLGGVGATPISANSGAGATAILPFRIDHDEHFNQTTIFQYNMPFRKSLWYSMNWRYDSGLVAGAAPCYNANTNANTDCLPFSVDSTGAPNPLNGQPFINLSGLSPDQEFQAGLNCDGFKATPTTGITTDGMSGCLASQLTSRLLRIPATGTEDADLNPTRIAPRNVFDMALGDDDIAHFGMNQHFHIEGRVTAVNIAGKYALYNSLSTFSGTHYLTPRAVTAQVSLHF